MSARNPTRVRVSYRGKTVAIDVQPSTTGAELRTQVAQAFEFDESVEEHDLVFRGHVHIASDRALAHYGLPQGAELHLLKKIPRPLPVSMSAPSSQGSTQEGLLSNASQPSKMIVPWGLLLIAVGTVVGLFVVARNSSVATASTNVLYQINVDALCSSLGNQPLDTSRSAMAYADEFPCRGGADHENTCGIPGMWAVDEAPWALMLWIVTTLLGILIPLASAALGKDLEKLVKRLKEELVVCCCIPSKPALLTYVLSGWFLGSYVVCSYILRLHGQVLRFLQLACAKDLGTLFSVCQTWVTWAPAWLWVLWPATFLILPAVILFDWIWPVTSTSIRVMGTNSYETRQERPMAVPLCVIGCLVAACLITAILSIPLSLTWAVAGLAFVGGPLAAALCWAHLGAHVAQHLVLKTLRP